MGDRTGNASDLDPDLARWLTGDDGLERLADAVARLDGGADALALGATLRDEGLTPDRAAAVSEGAFARIRARDRWDRADELVLTRTGLEQASDPAVSSWRARRFEGGDQVVDLAAGIGGDTIALNREVPDVIAVDRDESRLVLLTHNAAIHGMEPAVVVADALRLPLRELDLLHVDPSRRTGTRRARRLSDYSPPVAALAPLAATARGAAIVLSPAVDLDDPDLPAGEVEFVQVGRDLVEAVAWTGSLATGAPRSATILGGDGPLHRAAREEQEPPRTGPVGEWLIEVAPAAVRARIHDHIAAELGAHRLTDARALLTATRTPVPSPWYRAFPVMAEMAPRPKQVRAYLRERGDVRVELMVHGVSADPMRWWRDLGRPTRGWGGVVVHLVRTADGATCIVTGTPDSDGGGDAGGTTGPDRTVT